MIETQTFIDALLENIDDLKDDPELYATANFTILLLGLVCEECQQSIIALYMEAANK
jgi:hypothetical protein